MSSSTLGNKKNKRKFLKQQKKQKKELSMDEIKQVVNKWFKKWSEIEAKTSHTFFDGLDFILTTLDITPTVLGVEPPPLPDHMIRKYMALRDLRLWVDPYKDGEYTDTHVRKCFNRVSSYIYDAIENMTDIHVYHQRYSSYVRKVISYRLDDDQAWESGLDDDDDEKEKLDEKEMKELEAELAAAADLVGEPKKKKQKTYDDKKVQELLEAVSKAREQVNKCEEREAELTNKRDTLAIDKEQAVAAFDVVLFDLNYYLRAGSK